MGQTITRELMPNGSNIAVTRENRIRYIYLMAHDRLNTQIDRQCKAFFRGLSDLIDPKWLWMFNQQELQVMLGGAQTGISLQDLQQNVVYSNFERTDSTIKHFWSVVEEMSEEDRRLLIKFVTSCARPPLLGFAELNPKLCIRNAGQEEDRLPTSSTCMNLLKLPAFTSRQRLKEKLLYAIHSEAGFDLS
jgi:ubiquitin-protein ligase E3 C